MDELSELVEAPYERLDAEYKDWLDLSQEEHRANVARHVAALSNHGGGYLVFGFHDTTLAPTGPNPFHAPNYSHDGFGGVVRKYLEPAVQVSVRTLRSLAGNDHIVLVVPPHGAVPICCRQNGPGDAGGKPRGIVRGTYYTRKPLPESAPILTEAEWMPIIRRCAMHDKASLLAALTMVVTGAPEKAPSANPLLATWHAALRRKFLNDPQVKGTHLAENNAQFSYSIVTRDGEELAPSEMLDILTQVNRETIDRVNTGWSMFYPFTRSPIAPYFTTDGQSGLDDEEFIEGNLLLEPRDMDADMWRVSLTGEASLIRPIRLDYLNKRGWSPEKFSLNEATRNVAQLVRHAQGLSERFRSPIEVQFLCEWHGLEDRELADPNAYWSGGKVARTQSRANRGKWPVASLPLGWPAIVAELVGPLVRCFDPSMSLDAQWVADQEQTWRPMGRQWP